MRRPSSILPVSLFAVAAWLAMAAPTRAAVVLDRATLNSIVGGLAISENFEAYQIAAGGALAFNGVNALTSATILTSGTAQGPGLVMPGVSFSGLNVQWNAQAYYGAPSREILFNSNSLTIDFSTPATAFGLDLRNFSGYSSTVSVTVLAANGTTVLYSGSGLNLSGTAQFFGFEDAGGIGRVTLITNKRVEPHYRQPHLRRHSRALGGCADARRAGTRRARVAPAPPPRRPGCVESLSLTWLRTAACAERSTAR